MEGSASFVESLVQVDISIDIVSDSKRGVRPNMFKTSPEVNRAEIDRLIGEGCNTSSVR